MISRQEFEAIATEVVEQSFPSERKYWTANRRHVVDRVLNVSAKGFDSGATDHDDFKFLGDLVVGL